MVVILDSIREWKVLKRYATAPGGSAIYSSRGNIVAILGSLRASLAASRSWVVQSRLFRPCADKCAMNEDLLEGASWTGGLSLIALTVAIHALGVVMMALVMEKIRVRLDNGSLGLRYVTPIVIGLVEAVGLLLAVLHGIEATIWAAAYLWLGALGSPIYMRCSIPSTR